MPIVEPRPHVEIPKQFLTMHYLENYQDTPILVGGFKGIDQLNWVFSRKGKKRDDAYNVRLGKDEHGGVVKSRNNIKHAKFVLLYEYGKEDEGIRYAFRVKNTGEMQKQQMIDTGYINPHHDSYFCYFFDEEISLGEFDVNRIIKSQSASIFLCSKTTTVSRSNLMFSTWLVGFISGTTNQLTIGIY